MPDLHSGLATGIVGALAGFIFTAVLSSLPSSPLILVLYLVAGAATIGIIDVMPFWSTGYLIGWLGGTFLMFQGGVIDPLEMVFYFGAGILVLAARYVRF